MPPLQGLGIFGYASINIPSLRDSRGFLAYTRFVDKIQQSNIRTEEFQKRYRRKCYRKKTE